MNLKECTVCGIEKEEYEFEGNGTNTLTFCLTCLRAKQKVYRDARKDHYKNYAREYYRENKEKVQDQKRMRRNTDLEMRLKHMHRNAKQRASVKGFEFDLEVSDLISCWEKQQGRCALSKREMLLSGERMSDKVSLDRVDSKKGYVKNNIQLVTARVNYMKIDMDEKEFLELCKEVYLAVHSA